VSIYREIQPNEPARTGYSFCRSKKKKDACEDVSLLVMVLRLARLLPLQVLWPWVRRQRDARIEASGMRER
jgi:cytoskeletal protein RodZ